MAEAVQEVHVAEVAQGVQVEVNTLAVGLAPEAIPEVAHLVLLVVAGADPAPLTVIEVAEVVLLPHQAARAHQVHQWALEVLILVVVVVVAVPQMLDLARKGILFRRRRGLS